METDPFADINSNLSLAFEEQKGKQDQGDQEQDPAPEDEEDPQSDSRSESRTTDSRDEEPPSPKGDDEKGKETPPDPLATMTLDQLKAHPVLGKLIQSDRDRAIADANRGLTERIRSQTRDEIAKEQFEKLSEEELVEALKDPDTKAVWTRVMSAPPPSPESQPLSPAAQAYLTQLRYQTDRISSAGLDPETISSLAPEKHIIRGAGDPNEMFMNWVAMVDKAIVDNAVAKASAKNQTSQRAQELERRAEEPDPAEGLFESGRGAPPIPDVMTHSGMELLDDAFSRPRPRTAGRRR